VIRAAIVGGSGFVGGELLRILVGHPNVEVAAVTSTRFAGRPVHAVHPNLRDVTDLAFCTLDELDGYDVLFTATPHGVAMKLLPELLTTAKQIVDLSADFRIRHLELFERYYGPHAAAELVEEFVPGIPELYREKLRRADRIAVPGCAAVAAILALHPLAARKLVTDEVDVDARSGSSGSGAAPSVANVHPVRSGTMRIFSFGHRHEAEIVQQTGLRAHMTATGVEAVRGVQVLCRATLVANRTEKDVWKVYRDAYAEEPFVRLVKQRRGVYRQPEPKILTGSNFCDIGFSLDGDSRRLYAVAALDNLVKGAAGNAVQCLNVRMGWSERLGLDFPGLHPV
jgi:[amino group carrier protein]-6-phospho-L-2-aminoadipate/5-phospho-L-glutamate reductase